MVEVLLARRFEPSKVFVHEGSKGKLTLRPSPNENHINVHLISNLLVMVAWQHMVFSHMSYLVKPGKVLQAMPRAQKYIWYSQSGGKDGSQIISHSVKVFIDYSVILCCVTYTSLVDRLLVGGGERTWGKLLAQVFNFP